MARATNKAGVGARIRQILGKESVSAFARRCGISESLLRQYIAGSMPGLDKAALIARAGGVSLGWLATGEGLIATQWGSSGEGEDHTICTCTAHTEAAVLSREVDKVDFLKFKQDWVFSELKADPAEMCLLEIESESMEPTLRRGDIILVHYRERAIPLDGLYVLQIGEALAVKRVQRLADGMIKVASDNPAYEPFMASLADLPTSQLAVIGRVVWTGRKV